MPSEFDSRASTWDEDPSKRQRAEMVARSIHEAVPTSGRTRLLEYGAGTGLVAQSLLAHVGSLTLADRSAGMRKVLAAKIDSGALPPGARVWDLDLTTDQPPDERFDLIVTVMTLHHVTDVDVVLVGFRQLLDKGGHLCIVDLEPDGGGYHQDDPDFDGHDGFEREALQQQLHRAGLSEVRFEPCHEVVKKGRSYPLFLAIATG